MDHQPPTATTAGTLTTTTTTTTAVNSNDSFTEDIDSTCSTPYVSAPSSPSRVVGGFFYSAPASPINFAIKASSSSAASASDAFEFEFSARFGSSNAGGSVVTGGMSSADELFLNGQIRPMKLSTHLQRPQVLAPLIDSYLEVDESSKECDELEFSNQQEIMIRGRDLRFRDRSLRRRTRSMSPLRNSPSQWHDDEEFEQEPENSLQSSDINQNNDTMSKDSTPTISASSSRSSSSGRNSKRWIFLKEFLYRSKSEGRGNGKFWSSISFSLVSKEKKEKAKEVNLINDEMKKNEKANLKIPKRKVAGKPSNGIGKRRVPPSPHELHYTANRAQAEELRKRTYLPYRQGLLGCLGFSSKGYGAMNGFARALNPVSSR